MLRLAQWNKHPRPAVMPSAITGLWVAVVSCCKHNPQPSNILPPLVRPACVNRVCTIGWCLASVQLNPIPTDQLENLMRSHNFLITLQQLLQELTACYTSNARQLMCDTLNGVRTKITWMTSYIRNFWNVVIFLKQICMKNVQFIMLRFIVYVWLCFICLEKLTVTRNWLESCENHVYYIWRICSQVWLTLCSQIML